jgi:hypothetical protein
MLPAPRCSPQGGEVVTYKPHGSDLDRHATIGASGSRVRRRGRGAGRSGGVGLRVWQLVRAETLLAGGSLARLRRGHPPTLPPRMRAAPGPALRAALATAASASPGKRGQRAAGPSTARPRGHTSLPPGRQPTSALPGHCTPSRRAVSRVPYQSTTIPNDSLTPPLTQRSRPVSAPVGIHYCIVFVY